MTEFSVLVRLARFAATASLLLGCGSKGAVALTARVEAPELAVTSGVLARALAGEFDLVLSLGDLASDATTVSPPTFSVVRGEEVLLSPLALESTETFPLVVEPGTETKVRFTVPDSEIVSEDEAVSLCAGAVRISGAVTDTLAGGKPTPAESSSFEVSCP